MLIFLFGGLGKSRLKVLFILLLVPSAWATEFLEDEILALDQAANARSGRDFRGKARNVRFTLGPGAKVKLLSSVALYSKGRLSGNYGLYVEVTEDPRNPRNVGKRVWIHYNPKSPSVVGYASDERQGRTADVGRIEDVTLPPASAAAQESETEVIEIPALRGENLEELATRLDDENPEQYSDPSDIQGYRESKEREYNKNLFAKTWQKLLRGLSQQQTPSTPFSENLPGQSSSGRQKPGLSEQPCDNCSPAHRSTGSQVPRIAEGRFETCTKDNDYMTPRMPAQRIGRNLPRFVDGKSVTNDDSLLPIQCVIESQKSYPPAPAIRYGRCRDNVSTYTKWAPEGGSKRNARPCANETYATSIYNSFLDSAACLDVDPKRIFPLVAHESGFHVNAVSHTGCMGLGQLCGGPAAIADVNKEGSALKQEIQSSSNPACRRISGAIKKSMGSRLKGACDRIANKEGGKWVYDPAENIAYTMMYYRLNRKRLNYWSRTKYMRYQSYSRLSPQLRQEVLETLNLWIHNAGPRISETMVSFLRKGDRFESITEFKRMFAEHIRVYHRNRSHRVEVSKFMSSIDKRAKAVQDQMQEGEQCSRGV
jgi:hypothetical protein